MSDERLGANTETVSFSEASRCPKCGHAGEIKLSRERVGHTMHVLTCKNSVCLWYETDWVVQQLSDGTVPVRPSRAEEPQRPKSFPKLPGSAEKYLKTIEETRDEERGR